MLSLTGDEVLIKPSLTQISAERARQVHSEVPSIKAKAYGEVQPEINDTIAFLNLFSVCGDQSSLRSHRASCSHK